MLTLGNLTAAAILTICPVTTATGPDNVYDNAYKSAKMKVHVISFVGTTLVTLEVAGFPAAAQGRTFGAHVHAKPCGTDPAAAGPHSQHGTDGTLAQRELWLDVTVDGKGRGSSSAFRPWTTTAGSVIIHAKPTDPETGTAGDRLLCTTL